MNEKPRPKERLEPLPRRGVNKEEAAAIIGVGMDLYREHIDKQIRTIKVGTKEIVPIFEIDRYMEENADLVRKAA